MARACEWYQSSGSLTIAASIYVQSPKLVLELELELVLQLVIVCVCSTLAEVTSNLASSPLAVKNAFYRPVHTYVLNPKAVTMGELYGEVNKLTLEWRDGLLPSIVRTCCSDTSEDHHWIVCDSPVDALWYATLTQVQYTCTRTPTVLRCTI